MEVTYWQRLVPQLLSTFCTHQFLQMPWLWFALFDPATEPVLVRWKYLPSLGRGSFTGQPEQKV